MARIAGVPATVITRARAVLAALEKHGAETAVVATAALVTSPVTTPTQLTLFGYVTHPVVERLQTMDVDNLSPRQALTLLGELQEAARRT